MSILGKILGGIFGMLMAGPIGCAIGILVGHMFDHGLNLNVLGAHAEQGSFAQSVFFSTTFEMMGYIAKADGRVSEREIQMARSVMSRLQLNQEKQLKAIAYFNLGKSTQFNWETTMDNFIRNCGHHPQLVKLFIDIQLQAAFVDGLSSPTKHNALERLCLKLGIPSFILSQMEGQFYAEQVFRSAHSRTYQAPPKPPEDEIVTAYKILGVTKDVSNSELKKAYRQLMSQHHPDKLMAKGLPESMMKVATEKAQSIQMAYELICKARGMK